MIWCSIWRNICSKCKNDSLFVVSKLSLNAVDRPEKNCSHFVELRPKLCGKFLSFNLRQQCEVIPSPTEWRYRQRELRTRTHTNEIIDWPNRIRWERAWVERKEMIYDLRWLTYIIELYFKHETLVSFNETFTRNGNAILNRLQLGFRWQNYTRHRLNTVSGLIAVWSFVITATHTRINHYTLLRMAEYMNEWHRAIAIRNVGRLIPEDFSEKKKIEFSSTISELVDHFRANPQEPSSFAVYESRIRCAPFKLFPRSPMTSTISLGNTVQSNLNDNLLRVEIKIGHSIESDFVWWIESRWIVFSGKCNSCEVVESKSDFVAGISVSLNYFVHAFNEFHRFRSDRFGLQLMLFVGHMRIIDFLELNSTAIVSLRFASFQRIYVCRITINTIYIRRAQIWRDWCPTEHDFKSHTFKSNKLQNEKIASKQKCLSEAIVTSERQ